MIAFKQNGKFEYQLLCCTKNPLYISLLPNNTISKNFDSVISSIQAMSEIMGKVFDDYIYNFVNGYQKCDTEDERYAFLNKNVNKTLQFSTVFVSANNINYAGFADETQRTNDSIFFDTKDIIKIIKLSQALKIYSVVLNTETGIDLENRRAIFGEEVKVKLWIAEKLDRDLKKYHGLPQHLKRVQVNVATEGYLPRAMIKVKKELGRDIMAEVLTVFRKHWQEGNQWMVHLITKSHMVQKHLDIISAMRDQVQLEITITTLDESRRKQIECLAPSVKRRLEIMRKFADAGVFVRVMCMPLIGTRKDAEEISAVCFDHGAKAFKHKGVNYWDEKALLAGETVKDSGREDEVFDDLLLKSSELIFENGSPKKLIVKMPVIIRSGKSKRWQGYKKEDLREREMSIENSGYADINNINWGYVV